MRAGTTLGMRPKSNLHMGPLHSPDADDAIVLYQPKEIVSESSTWQMTSSKMKNDKKPVPEVHVVVDPVLGLVLRPHQVEGVKLYSSFFKAYSFL